MTATTSQARRFAIILVIAAGLAGSSVPTVLAARTARADAPALERAAALVAAANGHDRSAKRDSALKRAHHAVQSIMRGEPKNEPPFTTVVTPNRPAGTFVMQGEPKNEPPFTTVVAPAR